MTDLNARAASIFGTADGAPRWPYGLQAPVRSRHRATFERETRRVQLAQSTIVDWAEQYGLRATQAGCCPLWLLRPSSRRCATGACYNYGGLDYVWLDHQIGWLIKGRPAVITSAPYGDHHRHDPGIAEWLAKDRRLRTAYGTGWYGAGTTQIVVWRTDRITDTQPAGKALTPEADPFPPITPNPAGYSTPCPHCGTLCGNPESPDFLSVSGCGGQWEATP